MNYTLNKSTATVSITGTANEITQIIPNQNRIMSSTGRDTHLEYMYNMRIEELGPLRFFIHKQNNMFRFKLNQGNARDLFVLLHAYSISEDVLNATCNYAQSLFTFNKFTRRDYQVHYVQELGLLDSLEIFFNAFTSQGNNLEINLDDKELLASFNRFVTFGTKLCDILNKKV